MANDRTCLVLLHAFPVSSVMYGEVADALSDGVDLVLPEFRGFGGTEAWTERFMDYWWGPGFWARMAEAAGLGTEVEL